MDQRAEQLSVWGLADAGVKESASSAEFEVVSGDASFRRYFRQRVGDQSWILVDAPPEKENCDPFVAIARHWFSAGINVPDVLGYSRELGFMRLSDLGDELYLPHLDPTSADTLYRAAIDTLIQLQTLESPADHALPSYSEALLRTEMSLFSDWLCRDLLQLELTVEEMQHWAKLQTDLVESALAQPQVCVHRDYHSRNLMVMTDEQRHTPGVIDFQDAVVGPFSYDLVSLLRDCYITWPESDQQAWCRYFLEQWNLRHQDLISIEQLQRWFDLMGVQRHLKAAGIFARLYLRDGKNGYLADIPRTVGYIQRALSHYPEYQWLAEFIPTKLLPALLINAHYLTAVGAGAAVADSARTQATQDALLCEG